MFAPGDLPDGNGDCAPFPNETTPNDKVPAEMGAWFESVRLSNLYIQEIS